MPISVLVAEDEPKVARFIKKALEGAGMQAECVDRLDDVEAHMERLDFNVLILDRLLGPRDSLPLAGRLKKKFPDTKIIFLSALGDLNERVSGLELGADDYLAKPFHVSELVARVKALARRKETAADAGNILRYADLEIHLENQEVKRAAKTVALTSKEFKILTLLAGKPQKIFSKPELLDRVWGVNADPGSNVVEVAMNRLRAKIDEGHAVPLIHTRRGSGYWFGEANHD